jgi:hypothetical protein
MLEGPLLFVGAEAGADLRRYLRAWDRWEWAWIAPLLVSVLDQRKVARRVSDWGFASQEQLWLLLSAAEPGDVHCLRL